jgi:hypothetical protein
VSFLGSVPSSLKSQTLQVRIDQGEAFEVPLQPSSRLQNRLYREILEIPEVEGEGEHLVHVTRIPPGLAIDFASVKDNALGGKHVIVDDFSSDLLYQRNWKTAVNQISAAGLPYGFTTHASSTDGDNFSLLFTGEISALILQPSH